MFKIGMLIAVVFFSCHVMAAEWKAEPSLSLRSMYNDNVLMKESQDDPESSTGYTIEPRVSFSGDEKSVWNVSMDARGKITRFQDIEDADSENVFLVFNTGRKTERTDWHLSADFERNSNFDTDYDTESAVAGFVDDRTDRTTLTISPSVSWITSEISQVKLSLLSSDVSYDEVTNLKFQDYEYESVNVSVFLRVAENHQLGLSGVYSEYDSPQTDFSWDNSELSLDYVYTINEISNLSLSVGARKLESLLENVVISCTGGDFEFQTFGGCPVTAPVFGTLEDSDSGTVTDIAYTLNSELSSHRFSVGRTIIPSSFGGAQEQRKLSYVMNHLGTERFSTGLILDFSETETLSGINFDSDRSRYRVEPSLRYRLSKNWVLSFTYRYMEQNLTNSDEDSVSNAVFLNLFLHWPKLVTTY